MSTRFDLADPESREAAWPPPSAPYAGASWSCCRPTPSTASAWTPSTPDGVQRLLDAKGRGRDMPPPVLVSADHHPRRARQRPARLGRGTGRALLARPAHDRVPPAALPAVGPGGDPRDRRGADARRRGCARAARAHRSAGGVLGEHDGRRRPRPTPTRPRDARVTRSRWSSTTARARAPPPPRSSTAPASGRGSCARARSPCEELLRARGPRDRARAPERRPGDPDSCDREVGPDRA